MGIRETLNRNPGVTIGVVVALLIFIAVALFYWLHSGSGAAAAGGEEVGKNFFSADDGATYFADDATKYPPFTTKDGKQAVRAYVFKCADGKPFVGFLERYTPKGLQMLNSKSGAPIGEDLVTEAEVKKAKTGDTGWIKRTDPRAITTVMQVRCPDGKPADPVPIE